MEKVKNNISDIQASACDKPDYNRSIFKEADKVFKVIANIPATYKDATYEKN